MDSLTFRNQQLAKRVELLQEELAASEAKGKKSKVETDTGPLAPLLRHGVCSGRIVGLIPGIIHT